MAPRQTLDRIWPTVLINEICRSAMSICLRRLLRDMPSLETHIETVSTRQMQRMYAAPHESGAVFREMRRSQRRMRYAQRDAASHILLEHALPAAQATYWDVDARDFPLPEGHLSLVFQKPAGTVTYSLRRQHGHCLEAVTLQDNALSPPGEDLPDAAAGFVVADGIVMITDAARFAGFSPDLLPPDALDTMQHVLQGLRTELHRALVAHPALANSLTHLQMLVLCSMGGDHILAFGRQKERDIIQGLMP